jgi:hypothetical protein
VPQRPVQKLALYAKHQNNIQTTYRVLDARNRVRLTRCKCGLHLRNGQPRLRNDYTARRVQGLGVRCRDLLRWYGLHGRIPCQARLHSVLNVIGALRGSGGSRGGIVSGFVYRGGSLRARDGCNGRFDIGGQDALACHAGVCETIRVDGVLATRFAEGDHLDEAAMLVLVCRYACEAGYWRTYYALAVFKSSDTVVWIRPEATLPAANVAPAEIGAPSCS